MTRRSGTYATPDGVTHSWEQRPLPLDAIYLPRDLWQHAASVGLARFAAHLAAGDDGASTADPRNRMANDVLGAVAEAAVARHLNAHWSAGFTRPEHGGDLLLPFVGPAEVRSTVHGDGHLVVYQSDKDRPFVLVCDFGWTNGEAAMRCPGWILGADAQRPEFWRERGDRGCVVPAYWVPQSQLLPLSSLKSWTEGKGTG